jgi:outer membrane protein assembly factor BamB
MLIQYLPLVFAAFGQEWSSFRGPNSTGVSLSAKNLPVRFEESTRRWSVAVPFGRSSPVVNGDQVVITGVEGERLVVMAVDAKSGKERWLYERTRPRRSEIDANRNDPASSTPALDGEGVYVFFSDFGLVALDRGKGKVRWEMPLGPFINNYGMSTSPVLLGETVFLQVDQVNGSYLLAVDRRNGKVRWKTKREKTIEGWSTPIVTPRGEVVTLSSNGLEAFSAETGEQKWLIPAPDSLMIPVPVLVGDRIYAPIRGSEKVTFPEWKGLLRDADADGDGKLVPKEAAKRFPIASFGIADPDRDGYITEAEWNKFVNRGVGEFGFTAVRLSDQKVLWRHKRGLPYVPSPLVYEGALYSVRTGGILLALDAEEGTVNKEGRLTNAGGDYFASLVAGDGKIYAVNAEGKVTVIRPGKEWEIVSQSDLGEGVAATPAIVGDVMFVRTHQRLACYGVGQ